MQGEIVKSLRGHDKDKFFAVVMQDDRFVFLADGKNRKINAPKKKSIKHVVCTEEKINLSEYTDKSLRKLINRLNTETT